MVSHAVVEPPVVSGEVVSHEVVAPPSSPWARIRPASEMDAEAARLFLTKSRRVSGSGFIGVVRDFLSSCYGMRIRDGQEHSE